ncbi:MAG: glutamine amidotransferase [Pseudomonadales bacterium]|jgi:GMP synthase (glutamine-hydrolysing)|nr:glutamine amidotransferase [Pseudomonadales bacterium]MDP6469961.1 glutamine amidotransferase [Pseudomonadales bacterium]MDP6829128.1 glutamine amidotransferase [Pseudomonadales bacterium]MDP6971774.1 glutamine amidotransferase [Pseudomonadales bacterium]|tara:strand:- start:2832 stop:3569 length:738 start_codon:yes stop_codon:yes gene_type:complete
MSKPFLVIQLRPEDETAESEFAAIKRYGKLEDHEVIRHRAERSGLPEAKLDELSAIIVGGSPFDVSTPTQSKSAIQKRIEADFEQLFTAIEALDFPFLGACSGNGLLGNYCGATISTRYSEPVGATDITLTPAGAEDPLLEGLPNSFRVLVGHKEACDEPPPGTVLLAGSDACPVQMFRLKNNIYATQFHPEADREEFEIRINVYRDHGYFPSSAAEKLIRNLADESVPESNEILRRFVARYRTP